VSNWLYDAFAAANKGLLGRAQLAWAWAIDLIVVFLVIVNMNAKFAVRREGVGQLWRRARRAGGLAADPHIAHGLEPRTRARRLGQCATGG
jgi:hypothetical protein